MLAVEVQGDRILVGDHFFVSFMRTLRIPDDGRDYPLPPALGTFPIKQVADYADRVPAEWRERGGVFIPMYQREALWLSLRGHRWHPVALRVAVGRVDALTGERWKPTLSAKPQNYLVVPEQPWLDGINSGKGTVRQFVAMPLGQGYSVEAQLTGEEVFGGLQLRVHEAKPGRFPEQDPDPPVRGITLGGALTEGAMGLGAGGTMRQKLYPDPHGLDTWDPDNYGEITVHIVNSEVYHQITGEAPPPTPVDAATYTAHGYPWFDLYDADLGDLAPSDTLGKVKSVRELDQQKGLPPQSGDTPLAIPDQQVRTLDRRTKGHGKSAKRNRHWWDRLLHRDD